MKKLAFIFIAVFCLPFILFGCQNENQLNQYQIKAVFNNEEMTLNCEQQVTYVNNSSNALNEICFFLYANAFAEGEKPLSTSYFEKAYPNGESFGRIEIVNVKVAGAESEFSVSEQGEILTAQLTNTLFPNEIIDVEIIYTIFLANINHRLGYGENTVNFGNFFPIACVYREGEGFVKNSFVQSGDPFYSDVANFKVEIIYPQSYILASSGQILEENTSAGIKTSVCVANKVRDFAFVLSEKFEKVSSMVGDCEVNYFYYDDEDAGARLETAVKAVLTFEELFGDYEYKELNVVKTNFCFGGMEYPNLVMISDAILDEQTFDYVIVHEIAHQWWYGIVGNDEFSESWVDEGLTEFSTALFFEKNPEYGLNYQTIMENARNSYRNFVNIFEKINGSVDESMDRSLLEFGTEPEYVNCIYTKGMLLFDNLRQTMSERKFFKCLKVYFEDYSFKNSSADKLIESFSKTSGINLKGFIGAWLDGSVVIN